MALARLKTWIAETLNFTDLNGEFDNIIDNPMNLISPCTGNLNLDGHTLQNGIYTHTVQTLTANSVSPSVAGGTIFQTANTVPTTWTSLGGGTPGQIIWVSIQDTFTTVGFSYLGLSGNSGVDWAPNLGDSFQAFYISPTWYCILGRNG